MEGRLSVACYWWRVTGHWSTPPDASTVTPLLKLKAHGIGNGMINWIEKWLIDRRQRVVVDGEVSNWKSVLSGVPQGSVLGPILFLIYINDLDDDITSKVLKFADDTKVFRKIKSDADRQHLQDDLNKLIEWSEKWQMMFNFGKCKCLHTGHGNEDAQYTMGGTVLRTVWKCSSEGKPNSWIN